MTIEFLPLRQALEERRRELDEAFDRVLRSGWLILGREVEAFEQEFAAYCGASHCVTVGNGLDALAISLRAQGIGPGDEVIVPGHTFIASWLAVTQIGAVPVPADVDPASCNIDPGSAASAVTPRTAAIMHRGRQQQPPGLEFAYAASRSTALPPPANLNSVARVSIDAICSPALPVPKGLGLPMS